MFWLFMLVRKNIKNSNRGGAAHLHRVHCLACMVEIRALHKWENACKKTPLSILLFDALSLLEIV